MNCQQTSNHMYKYNHMHPLSKREGGSMRVSGTTMLSDQLPTGACELEEEQLIVRLHTKQSSTVDQPVFSLEPVKPNPIESIQTQHIYLQVIRAKDQLINFLRNRVKSYQSEQKNFDQKYLDSMQHNRLDYLSSQVERMVEELGAIKQSMKAAYTAYSEVSSSPSPNPNKSQIPDITPISISNTFQPIQTIRTKRINRNYKVDRGDFSPFVQMKTQKYLAEDECQLNGQSPAHKSKEFMLEDQQQIETYRESSVEDRIRSSSQQFIRSSKRLYDQLKQAKCMNLCSNAVSIKIEPLSKILQLQPQTIRQIVNNKQQPVKYNSNCKTDRQCDQIIVSHQPSPSKKLSENCTQKATTRIFKSLVQVAIDSINNSCKLALRYEYQNKPVIQSIKVLIKSFVEDYNLKYNQYMKKNLSSLSLHEQCFGRLQDLLVMTKTLR